jgi:hypothetical protein
MRSHWMTRGALAALCLGLFSGAAAAQQIVNFSVGAFVPRGEDARVEGDVLTENRTFLTFDIGDFTGPSVGGEWLGAIGDYFEIGAGASFYRRSTDSVYSDFVDRDGSEIAQELRLRLVPVSASIRMTPFGNKAAVQPYFGAGVQFINWRYSESGEFIDFNTPARDLFRDAFVASGTTAGPLVVGGIRFNGGGWVTVFELQYTKAEAALNEDFAGDKLDLGGWNYLFTIGKRWGE